MGLTVRATFDDVRPLGAQLPADFSGDGAAIAKLRKDVLTSVGFVLIAKQRKRFLQLSKTGSADGTSWMAPKPSTVRRRQRLARQGQLKAPVEAQGIVTGELASSFAFTIADNLESVRMFSHDPKFNLFDVHRRIYPATMPASWQASVNAAAQRTIDRLTK